MNRKILAWDVGIKNLAYCVISKVNDKIDISKWEIIDIIDSNLLVCCGTLKSKEVCGAHAKYFIKCDNTTKYYCCTHKSQPINIKETAEKHININKDKCTTPECPKLATWNFNGTLCCTVHKNSLIKKSIKDSTPKPIPSKKCTSTDPQILFDKLYNKLNNIDFSNLSISEVYVENQPLVNPTMKTISIMLFSYFAYYSKTKGLNMTIKFISPTFKIDMTPDLIKFANEYIASHNQTKKKQNCKCRTCKLSTELTNYDKTKKLSYNGTKEMGIIYTKKVLQDNNVLESFSIIKKNDKKDDLCDAFLHAYRKL